MTRPSSLRHPALSVLMPAFNAAPFIGAAIRSVLAQRFGAFELLIVDDGSTDTTWEVIGGFRDPRIRAWRQPNGGKSRALNAMLGRARGSIIALQDADDTSPPDRLGALATAFREAPGLAGVLTGHALLVGDRVVAPRAEAKPPGRCRAEIAALRMPAHDPTLACRTDLARSLGFDPELRLMEGVDFVFRLAERHDIAVLGQCLYHYRLHPGSLTRGDPRCRRDAMRGVFDAARTRRGLAPLSDAAFDARFGRAARDPANNLIGHFTDSTYQQVARGRRREALSTALAAFGAAPLRPGSAKPLAYALMPKTLARTVRRHALARRLAA